MIYFKLLWSFFKIGMFSFGGGYVMIPLIQKEIENNGWIRAKEFADIVAISQMTPGPIAVNAATYVGVRTAGVLGSAFATLGVSLPSFILIMLIANFLERFKENNAVEAALKGIRPATIGLIASAVIFFANMSVFNAELPFNRLGALFTGHFQEFGAGFGINPGAALILIIIVITVKKFKLHPIYAVILSALLGVVLV